jgi:hypothetical protein
VIHRSSSTKALLDAGIAEAVPWCKTHQQEMLTGLRCAIGWDEEIAALRAEITEIKLRLERRMVL